MIYAEHILICVAAPLMIALAFTKGASRRFTASVLAGMGVCLLAAYISAFINALIGIGEAQTKVFISPAVEEIMKLVPLLFCLFLLGVDERGLLLMAVGVGTGFAIFENCCYLAVPEMRSFAFVAVRGFAVGVMHVVSAVSLALGLALARRFRAVTLPGILGALSLSATFHGLYNLLVSHSGVPAAIGYTLPLLTAGLLYAGFRRFHIMD